MMDVTLNFKGVRGRRCVRGAFLPPHAFYPAWTPWNSMFTSFFFPFVLAMLVRFKGQNLTCDQESGLKLIQLQLFALIKDKSNSLYVSASLTFECVEAGGRDVACYMMTDEIFCWWIQRWSGEDADGSQKEATFPRLFVFCWVWWIQCEWMNELYSVWLYGRYMLKARLFSSLLWQQLGIINNN